MKDQPVRTYRSDENLGKHDQLAWKLAEVATETARHLVLVMCSVGVASAIGVPAASASPS